MALERKSYEGAMRAIRRFVIGTHRISDDLNLAYALFVMSIESLAQKFDGFEPVWDDYDQNKRRRIDNALVEADLNTKTNIREAILTNEHVAIGRRFREFALAYIGPTFFREEAQTAVYPVSRPDLDIALKQAYSIRSRYVHHLEEMPPILVGAKGLHELSSFNGQPVLTFAGLTRVARHVIKAFVAQGPKIKNEVFEWRKALPGVLTMQMAPQYWIHNAQNYEAKTAQQFLIAFISQIVEMLLDPSKKLSDIRDVLKKAETIVSGLAKPTQRLPILALYFLFNYYAPEDFHSPGYPSLLERFSSDLESPSVISLVIRLLSHQTPDWPLPTLEELHSHYFKKRHHSDALNIGRFLEAAFTLTVAEKNRLCGNLDKARQLIAFAVETYPSHVGLQQFETSTLEGELRPICWDKILLPSAKQTE